MGKFVHTNDIQLHYLDHPGEAPTIVLLHGLSANAHSFAGLVQAGLPNRLLAVDLRGRGQSDQPASGYSMADHAADILGLLDALGLEQVVLGGHSFGGLLTLYMAVHHPQRVRQCLIIDAGILHPDVRQLIAPSLARLGQTYPSWAVYKEGIQAAAYWQGIWDEAIEAYYEADVYTHEDGTVTPIPSPAAIAEAAAGVPQTNWAEILPAIKQPTLLLNGPLAYGDPGTPAVMPQEQARQTADLIPNCTLVEIPGNHMTMLFGDNAKKIVAAIVEFVE